MFVNLGNNLLCHCEPRLVGAWQSLSPAAPQDCFVTSVPRNDKKRSVTKVLSGWGCWTFPVPCYILKEIKMRSSLIGKIEKAKRYAKEPDRVTFSGLTAVFHGENDDHKLSYAHGKWHCTCLFFSQWETCSHIMALQQILGKMLPKEALASPIETDPQPLEK